MEIEEHLSVEVRFQTHVVDHFRRMSEPDVWAVRAGVRRAEEGEEGGRGAVESTHVSPLDISLGNPINSLSPDLEIGAISPIISPYVCIHVIHAACLNRRKRAVSFIHGDLVRSPDYLHRATGAFLTDPMDR